MYQRSRSTGLSFSYSALEVAESISLQFGIDAGNVASMMQQHMTDQSRNDRAGFYREVGDVLTYRKFAA